MGQAAIIEPGAFGEVDFAALGRESLLAYVRAVNPRYRIAPHLEQVAQALERAAMLPGQRIMVFMPPRHGKSMLVSRYFPAWYLGQHSDRYIIYSTYGQDLADDFGRQVRDQMSDPLYQAIFETRLRRDTQSVDRQHTTEGGQYNAVGVGGAITGRGAHLLLIDDPVKSREEADSEVYRKRTRDWYTSVAYTRLMPGASVVIVQTRWHEDDLSGWLLSEHQHEQWEIISLPAIDDQCAALWPEMYPTEELQRIQRAIGFRDWHALYQQTPMPDTGGYFQAAWLKDYRELPKNQIISIYGASDYAVTDGGGDYTEHGIFGVDKDSNIYLIDWWSGQTDSAQWIDAMLDLIAIHRPIAWVGESGPIKKAVEPFLTKRMMERRLFTRLDWMPSIHSKEIRLRGFQALSSLGRVHIPGHQPWGDAVKSQLLSFPAGKYDDKADVCGLFARALTDIWPGTDGVQPQKAPKLSMKWMEEQGYLRPIDG